MRSSRAHTLHEHHNRLICLCPLHLLKSLSTNDRLAPCVFYMFEELADQGNFCFSSDFPVSGELLLVLCTILYFGVVLCKRLASSFFVECHFTMHEMYFESRRDGLGKRKTYQWSFKTVSIRLWDSTDSELFPFEYEIQRTHNQNCWTHCIICTLLFGCCYKHPSEDRSRILLLDWLISTTNWIGIDRRIPKNSPGIVYEFTFSSRFYRWPSIITTTQKLMIFVIFPPPPFSSIYGRVCFVLEFIVNTKKLFASRAFVSSKKFAS